MDQTQPPIANTPPVAAAIIPAGQTSAQRLEQLKADPAYMRRWASGDKSADAEMLALTRYAGRQPTAPVAAPAPVDAATAAKERLAPLRYDPEWMKGFQKHGINGPQGREFDALTRAALGQQQPPAEVAPTPNDRALEALGAPPTPEDYKVNARDPVRGWPLKLDEETRTLVHGTLLPAAHALDLSQADVDMIVMAVQKPMSEEQCEASLKRIYGNGLDAALDDFRAAVSAHPKGREFSQLLERYPQTLGNNPALISSIVAVKRRKGVR